MNQQKAHILTLIKLQEGHLSDAEGLLVREQLASDSLLLQRWKTLSLLYEQENSQDESTEPNATAMDAETVAAFVEERMSSDERREFETACWNQTESLREVISAYQAVQGDNASNPVSQEINLYTQQTSKRMSEAVKVHCRQLDPVPVVSHYLQKIEDHPELDSNAVTSDFSEPEMESVEPLSRRTHFKPRSALGNQRKAQRQQRIYIAVAVAVIVIAIPVYFGLIQDRGITSITENPVPEPRPFLPEPPRSKIKQHLHSETVPKLTVVPETKQNVDNPKPSPKMIPVPPVMDNQNNEKPIVAKKGPTVVPVTNLDLQIDWVRLSGIIGIRTADSLPWKGILTDASTKRYSAEKYLELHTLPFSWLQAKMISKSSSAGPEMVLDSDSEIQIAMRGVNSERKAKQDGAESATIQTVIDLKLIAGKVAFSQLQAGDELQFQDQLQVWLIQVQQDGTSIGFIQRADNKREMMAFSGEVQVTSTTSQQTISLKSNQMIVIRNQTLGTPLKVAGTQRWRTEPTKSLKLSKSFIEKMNQSDDLLSSLLTLPPGKGGAELLASTNLGFALDPVTTVSQAAFSKSEVQRTAAISWLLAAKEDPTTQAVWRKIAVASNAGPTTPSIRIWFNMAQGKAPRNQKILAELSAGLGASQPLFVRQCSIHFLRQITRQRLAEYDPNQPSTAAINSVRQKVRRATGNTRPKSNTRPKGNNNQRRP
ncbi:MAG: hypothetical protein K0U86_18325 [Planctomycetes bacterium]|nr:hypothetical protein [Planctomycetota bacterium]MCH9726863.1 hypothetical protein [Planctomycetota bacterium]MCH9775547.1 hypothetical protein [Planctomycetota bacterium]MCH9791635.1 hypothetical protein [Planctomycetota bacterium]